jgi:1,4-alpha-glucan branching enzyme
VVVISNMTPLERGPYRVGVPAPGRWLERLNTDAPLYGGAGRGNLGHVDSTPTPWHGREHSLALTLPPLSTLILEHAP